MLPVAVPDYVRFGPLNGLRLFRAMTLYPSLERLLHTPVPTLAVLGGRDPLIPSPARVREVARLSPEHLAVALVEKAAHALNFSHPEELAGAIEAWLDDALVEGAPSLTACAALATVTAAVTASVGYGDRRRLDLGRQRPETPVPRGPARIGRARRSRGRPW